MKRFFLVISLILLLTVIIPAASVRVVSAQTPRLLLLWDGGTAPTGWTSVSASGGAFYQMFPRGAATYGGTGGTATHTHTLSLVTCSAPSATVTRASGTSTRPSPTHTHTVSSSTVGTASNLPNYRNLQVIRYDAGIPATIPAGAIAIFDSTPPSGWTQYSVENGYFVRGEAAAGGTGGSNTNTHTVNLTTSDPSATIQTSTGTGNTIARENHTHTGTGTSSSGDNQPPYREAILAKANNATSIPIGIIGMFDASPSSCWTVVSGAGGDLYQRFIKGSSSYGLTGGSDTHSHTNFTITTGGPSNTRSSSTGTATTLPSSTHTHDMTISFGTTSYLPSYRDVIFAKLTTTIPDSTITAPSSVYPNSIGNSASVPYAGSIATYTWAITNGTITAGQGTRSITWSALSTSPVTIGVTVDVSGCQSNNNKQITLTTPTTLSVSIAGNDNFCPGGSTTLTANAAGGTPPYTYLWSTGATAQSITVTAAGHYSVAAADSTTCSSTIVSDNNTMVTRGNVSGATYPTNAVLAWVHGSWWTGLTGYNFGYPSNTAQWIWESYRPVHPQEGDVVFFQRTFNIPSTPIGATIHATCDNGYEIYINNNYLGWAQLADYNGILWENSDLTDNWVFSGGWQSVETYTVPASSLLQGNNVLVIQTANEQVTGGTVDGNPAGLVYDVIYQYYCTTSTSIEVTLNLVPVASFTAVPLSGFVPLSVQFTNASTGSSFWAWDFDNNGTIDSTSQNPAYIYTAAGTYTVKLTAYNGYGCSNSITRDAYINVNPQPTPPTISAIDIYDTKDCLGVPVPSMTPQTPYYAKVSITSNINLNYLQTVQVTLFYNDGVNPNLPAPTTGNTQTCAILTCTVGTSPSWAIEPNNEPPNPANNTTWGIVLGDCVQPALNQPSGDWIFAFIPGKVATESVAPARWDARGKVTNKSSQSGELYVRNKAMNWYGEIIINSSPVDWGEVPLGLKFQDAPNPKAVSTTYIANGDYWEDIMSSDTWTGGGQTVTLDISGIDPAPAGTFALKADNTLNYDPLNIVKSTQYLHINASGSLTTEAGVTVTTNGLWLSIGEADINPVKYSGTIYYQISDR